MSDGTIKRWRVVIAPIEPGIDRRGRLRRWLHPLRFHWTREWSATPGRWILEKQGYTETLTVAKRRAMRSTWALWAREGKRLEMEYAMLVPAAHWLSPEVNVGTPELLEDRP